MDPITINENFNDNKDCVHFVVQQLERRQKERKEQELQWLLNINFLLGNQNRHISTRGEIEDDFLNYRWQLQEVFNHTTPIVETRLAKLARVRPTMTVRAASGDREDEETAKLATKILKGAVVVANLSEVINEATKWSEVCGTSFYKVLWDDTKGEQTKTGSGIGDISVVPLSPFELYPDNAAESDIQRQHSIIHAKAYPVRDIKELFHVDIEGQTLDIYTLSCTAVPHNQATETLTDAAAVIEYYEKPSATFPDGRLLIVAGDQLLYNGSLPYVNGFEGSRTYPFVRQCALCAPGSFWGSSVIERLIPVQRAYNMVKNRKYELLNRVIGGVLAVEDGSVDLDELEQDGLSPGKVLVYRQGTQPPKEMTNLSVPLDFVREEERLLNEFILISGVSELMRNSKSYMDNTSGVALQLLAEQDNTRLLVTVDYIKNAIRTVARQILWLYKQFADDKRNLRCAGKEGATEVIYFNQSNITSDDVIFDTENEFSETAAQRRSTVMQLLGAGLLHNEDGILSNFMRKQLLDILGFSALGNALIENANVDGMLRLEKQKEPTEPLDSIQT